MSIFISILFSVLQNSGGQGGLTALAPSLTWSLRPFYHVVVEKSDGLNFHAKQIAHANVLILVDVEGGLVKATKLLEKSI